MYVRDVRLGLWLVAGLLQRVNYSTTRVDRACDRERPAMVLFLKPVGFGESFKCGLSMS